MNPFEPPDFREDRPVAGALRPTRPGSVGQSWLGLAAAFWILMTIKLSVVSPILRAYFESQFGGLPWLSQWLLHPMTTVLFVSTTVAVIGCGLVVDSAGSRQRAGRIAIAMAVVAAAVCVLGLWWPVLRILAS